MLLRRCPSQRIAFVRSLSQPAPHLRMLFAALSKEEGSTNALPSFPLGKLGQKAVLKHLRHGVCPKCLCVLQSCRRQAEYVSKQQRASGELTAARAAREKLTCSQAQAEATAQAAHEQLRDLNHQHRKVTPVHYSITPVH